MPSVILNKKVVEQLIGKKLPLDELKDRISMLGTDLDKIENDEIHVEIFPNRPDMLSEPGFARALASFIGTKPGLKSYTVKKSGHKVIVDPSVTMRPYTACAIVKNITFTDERIREIMQVQEKLATTHGRNRKKSAYGIYPLNNIEFPITYIAKDPSTINFKPLGFTSEMKASDIAELHPKGRSYKHLTEGWKKYPFFIDAKNSIMCMLPFTNSEDTGKVTTVTKNVFIESTGINLENVQLALNMMVTALADMGGEIYSLEIVYGKKVITTPDLSPKKSKINLANVNKMLGLNLTEKDLKKYLERMGFGYDKGSVLIPSYRADILHEVDFIEDIAIAYGYENFEPTIPTIATIGQEDPLEKFIRKLRMILIGIPLVEVCNYHLMQKDDLDTLREENQTIIPLKNAIGEHNHLRHSLLPSLLRTLATNQHNEYPQNIFETGKVFNVDKKEECGITETMSLGIALCHEKADFTEIHQAIDVLLRSLGLQVSIHETEHPAYITGRVGKLIIDKHEIGIIGEIHPAVLEKWKITMPIVVAEINVEKVYGLIVK